MSNHRKQNFPSTSGNTWEEDTSSDSWNIQTVTFGYSPPWPGKQSWVFPGRDETQNQLQKPFILKQLSAQPQSQKKTALEKSSTTVCYFSLNVYFCDMKILLKAYHTSNSYIYIAQPQVTEKWPSVIIKHCIDINRPSSNQDVNTSVAFK